MAISDDWMKQRQRAAPRKSIRQAELEFQRALKGAEAKALPDPLPEASPEALPKGSAEASPDLIAEALADPSPHPSAEASSELIANPSAHPVAESSPDLLAKSSAEAIPEVLPDPIPKALAPKPSKRPKINKLSARSEIEKQAALRRIGERLAAMRSPLSSASPLQRKLLEAIYDNAPAQGGTFSMDDLAVVVETTAGTVRQAIHRLRQLSLLEPPTGVTGRGHRVFLSLTAAARRAVAKDRRAVR